MKHKERKAERVAVQHLVWKRQRPYTQSPVNSGGAPAWEVACLKRKDSRAWGLAVLELKLFSSEGGRHSEKRDGGVFSDSLQGLHLLAGAPAHR